MSSNDDWLTRQRRMVKCPKHGLHFDPKMSTGCMRCLKERSKVRRRRRPQPLIILACILGMTIVLFRIFGPNLKPKEEALEGLAISEASAERALDPAVYRQNIESFEGALFASEVIKSSDLEGVRARIRSALSIFADALQLQGDGDSIAAREVEGLEAELAGSAWTYADLETLRDHWLRIRRRHFATAEWYHTPAASTRSAAAAQRASVAEYRDIANELANLLRQSSSEINDLTTVPGDRVQAWKILSDDLNSQLRDIAARRPSRPRADSDSSLLVAFQNLERAFNMARSLGAAAKPPTDASRVEDALRTAEQAVVGFEEAM